MTCVVGSEKLGSRTQVAERGGGYSLAPSCQPRPEACPHQPSIRRNISISIHTSDAHYIHIAACSHLHNTSVAVFPGGEVATRNRRFGLRVLKDRILRQPPPRLPSARAPTAPANAGPAPDGPKPCRPTARSSIQCRTQRSLMQPPCTGTAGHPGPCTHARQPLNRRRPRPPPPAAAAAA